MSSKANILIVDDLPQNLKLLAELMRDNNYYVRPVTSGKLALLAAQAIPPDLILLDINMPVMDGFETCEQLKTLEKTKHIPIIFLSANTESDAVIKGFELGAVDYITKPFKATEVILRVKTHLELKFSRETILKQNNSQRELLHILCHDLMNSVGAAQSLMMIKKIGAPLSEEDEVMSMAINNAVDVIGLVHQLRRLEENKVSINLSEHNLKTLVNETLLIVHEKIQKKNLEVVVNIKEDEIVIVESVSFINSVMNNLLTNAIKFSFSEAKIIISAQKQGETVYLSVKDFGIGMPKKLQEDVFKIEKATTREGTNGELGTGFGMPLVKKFMRAYGGKIDIISQEKTTDSDEHGTEIKLELNTLLEVD
ncbi:MAG: hybrid sensor histidine kinase/response regulator, partial [Methylococcales bacterium]|nr:hybrid sensor histidine kinase/response regulator [Methylococcales bacterium]